MNDDDVLGGLAGRLLQMVPLQPLSLFCVGGNPVCDVVLSCRLRTGGWPTHEIWVLQVSIFVQVYRLYVIPIGNVIVGDGNIAVG